MTHEQTLRSLDQDLDDLKVRNPKKYAEFERRLKLIESEAGFTVAQSPPGVRRMERMK